jgi:hypothetical protein
MMKRAAMKPTIFMVGFLLVHTTGYHTFSGGSARQAEKIDNG